MLSPVSRDEYMLWYDAFVVVGVAALACASSLHERWSLRHHQRDDRLYSNAKAAGAAFEVDMENFVFSSWSAIRIRIGEPYVLTARLSQEMPNGASCAVEYFKGVAVDAVRNAFDLRLDVLMGEKVHQRPEASKRTLPMAWGPVRFSGPAPPAPFQKGSSARDVAKATLEEWIRRKSTTLLDRQVVVVPHIRVRMPSGKTTSHTLLRRPELESVMSAGGDVVAIRTQLPIVPGAVRTTTSTLSATVRRMAQRIVVHCTHAPDTTLSDEAHNAPLFIALTRVVNAADLALSTVTKIHANVFKPRRPLREMLSFLNGLGPEMRPHCTMYHCRAYPNAAQPAMARDGAVHDEGAHAKAAAGFFEPVEGEAEALLLHVVPEEDLGV